MRHHDAPGRDRRIARRQRAGDEFIGQAVKPIAPHALLVERVRNGEAIGDGGMAAMERGVEAGDLRQAGKPRGERLQHRQRRGVVQRRQRRDRLDPRQRGGIDQHRRGQRRAAMHDPMAEAGQVGRGQRPVGQAGQGRQRLGMIAHRQRRLPRRGAVGGRDAQASRPADAFHLAGQRAVRRAPGGGAVEREFQARRAGVQHTQAA